MIIFKNMELEERLILIRWDKYRSHHVDKKNKKDEVFDNTIYTFDIETT